jgi:hypothetical protein
MNAQGNKARAMKERPGLSIILKVKTSTKKKFLVPFFLDVSGPYLDPTSDRNSDVVKSLKHSIEDKYKELYHQQRIYLGTTVTDVIETYSPEVTSLTVDGANVMVETLSNNSSSPTSSSWKHKYEKKHSYRYNAESTLKTIFLSSLDDNKVCYVDCTAGIVLRAIKSVHRKRPGKRKHFVLGLRRPGQNCSTGAKVVLSIVKKYKQLKQARQGLRGVFLSLGVKVTVPDPKLIPGIIENLYEISRFNRHRKKSKHYRSAREEKCRKKENAQWIALAKSNWSKHFVPFKIGKNLLVRNPVVSHYGSDRYRIRSEKRCDREMLDHALRKAELVNNARSPDEIMLALQNKFSYSLYDAVEIIANSYFSLFRLSNEYRDSMVGDSLKVPLRKQHAARRKGILLALLVENKILQGKFVEVSVFGKEKSLAANIADQPFETIPAAPPASDERKEVTF